MLINDYRYWSWNIYTFSLRKLDIDPAIATGPFVTTSIDILGVFLYFLIAELLLQI